MRTFIDPPLHAWSPAARPAPDRPALLERINAHARRLGTAAIHPPHTAPLIATGHQAWLWHPGILAKDIAARVAADRFGGAPLHLVVDQDAHAALSLEVPEQHEGRLRVRPVRLAPHPIDVPTGMQPPVDAAAVRRTLADLRNSQLAPLIDAFTDLPDCRTLAEQMAVVLVRLMQPTTGLMPVMFTSDLAGLPSYQVMLDAMLADAAACVRAYNAAVAAHPAAGVVPLTVERERVELPLWLTSWGQPRERVYADLADREAIFTREDGEPIDPRQAMLLPRALTLTAAMRSIGSELFIHGRGGSAYDQITEQWWDQWRGEPLAPRAVASADAHLDFDTSVADRAELDRAVWFRHHVPHNVDRVLGLSGPRTTEKQYLLAHMDDDRDKRRRRRAFKALHHINADLAAAHPELLAQADARLHTARLGVENARLARKRDWCFALYPPEALAALRDAIASLASV